VTLFSMDSIEALSHQSGARAEMSIFSDSGSTTNAVSAILTTQLSERRHFTQHQHSVESISFHPSQPLVASGSRGGEVFIWSYRTPSSEVKEKFSDAFAVRALQFDCSGEFLLYATDHQALRLFHVSTKKLLTVPSAVHSAAIADACFSSSGLIATTSFDASFAVYDAVSGKVIHHVAKAHGGVPVTSCVFSRSGNVLLTAGMDSVPRLWDLRKSCLEVSSFGEPVKSELRLRAEFSVAEDSIVAQDSTQSTLHSFDVVTGDAVMGLSVPQQQVKCFSCSPVSTAIVSGGEDCRVRVWGLALSSQGSF
jgi:cleavage stimulation factor subunit 1